MIVARLRNGVFNSLKLDEQPFERWFQRHHTATWHSFDKAPWRHPWLTVRNLTAMREFSARLREQAHDMRRRAPQRAIRHAFVCNVANSMYTTAKAIAAVGTSVDLVLHPGDDFLMSQPEWEEFDGEMRREVATLAAARDLGARFPPLEHVYRPQISHRWTSLQMVPDWVPMAQFYRWRDFYSYLPVLEKAREYDSLFVMQCPYLAYLSRKPYIATHMGGDIWYECSRNDMLGQLQRESFAKANLFIASNPWSYAFARRYGMRNVAYVPTLLNAKDYSPGVSPQREAWHALKGGDFFVLTTARIDTLFKGTQLPIEAFARFAATHPGARLVIIGWGQDLDAQAARIEALQLANKVLVVPPAGKQRLIAYLRAADCLLDQFVLGYYGMTALEALACGLPTIARLEVQQYDAFSDAGCPPAMNAATVDGIVDALTTLHDKPDFRRDLAARSREWFMRYSGNEAWADVYLDLLGAAASGHRFDFRNSPLNTALGDEELEYHRQGLLQAPVFPNYF